MSNDIPDHPELNDESSVGPWTVPISTSKLTLFFNVSYYYFVRESMGKILVRTSEMPGDN